MRKSQSSPPASAETFDSMLARYRELVDQDRAAKRAMASAERMFSRIDQRTKLGEDRSYELAGVSLADHRSLATSAACREALEQMHALAAASAPPRMLTMDRVLAWATAMGAHLSCKLSEGHTAIANDNRA